MRDVEKTKPVEFSLRSKCCVKCKQKCILLKISSTEYERREGVILLPNKYSYTICCVHNLPTMQP